MIETERTNLRKKALLAILMAAVMLLSGCTLIVKDAEVDKSTPIVTVNDTVYTKQQVQAAVNTELQNEYMNSYYMYMYGLSDGMLDINDPAVVSAAQDAAIDNLIKEAVKTQKMQAEGLYELTSEEAAQAQADAEEDFASLKEEYKASYLTDTELEGDELDKAEIDGLAELGYTMDSSLASTSDALREDKLRDWAIKDVEVTDEDVKAEFDTRVENDKETYAENANSYVTAMNNGTQIYYAPEGVRAVQQILVAFTDEDKAAITDIRNHITDAITAASTATSTLVNDLAVEDAEALAARVQVKAAEGDTFEAAEITDDFAGDEAVTDEAAAAARDLAKANAEKAFWQDKLAAARAAAFANIDEEADAIIADLETGDWDTIAAEKNTDPGANAESYKKNGGYLVCDGMTSFDAPFVAAATALTEIGQISPKTACGENLDYGYYILKYVKDVPAGAVEQSPELSETIKAEVLSERQDETYTAAVDAWVKDAKVTIDKAAMAD